MSVVPVQGAFEQKWVFKLPPTWLNAGGAIARISNLRPARVSGILEQFP